MDRRRKTPIPENIQRRITKIFVTNLSEGCSGTDLATTIRSFGQIYDLYIARKRDRGGNRFGFISILDVKDKGELLKNLRGIRIGDNKLWFNITRYILEDGEVNLFEYKQQNSIPKDKSKVGSSFSSGPAVSGDWSFKEMLVGKSINIDSNVNAFSTLHGRAVVTRMIDVEALKNIYVILNDICPGSGKVQYLGGLDLLISFEDAEKAVDFRCVAVSLKDKFAIVSSWEGQSLGFERLAWVKVQGIPLHLLLNEVIDEIGGLIGKVVHKAKKSESDQDLSFEYVGVLVGDGKRISEEILLNWQNRKFRVWVTEEVGDWVPDFDVVTTIRKDDDMASEDSEAEESSENNSDQSSEGSESDDDVIPEEEADYQENIECTFNENIDDQSLGFKEGAEIEENSNDNFIPAVDFDFDTPSENLQNSTIISKIVKRKKCKKSEVGRSSYNYISSNESLKPGKKPKNIPIVEENEDIFGLDSLLGLVKSK
ncbi:putative RNA recognition motif domain, nucleotide-binding alpha-beta plait domain superfamily [Helianthus annuus]|nr:putative RNA recognition motif domain, nucleotide-binding alpha-beta plait domain superfamily [Helianthus annuus]